MYTLRETKNWLHFFFLDSRIQQRLCQGCRGGALCALILRDTRDRLRIVFLDSFSRWCAGGAGAALCAIVFSEPLDFQRRYGPAALRALQAALDDDRVRQKVFRLGFREEISRHRRDSQDIAGSAGLPAACDA